jgi:hypothetical protein
MQTRIAAVFIASAFAVGAVAAQNTPVRPKITNLSHLAVYTSDAAATEHYYTVIVGAIEVARPGERAGRALCAEPNPVH